MNPAEISEILRRCREGDEESARDLFSLYARRLTHIADQHLSRKLAGREDGEDVVQSVFRTFFRRTARGEFRVNNAEQLWNLLVQITLRKARSRGRFHTAGKRDVAAEEGEAWLYDALAEEPGPAEAAQFVDLIETLLRGLPPLYGRLLEMRLQGHEAAAIAGELAVSRQTVYRVLDLLRQRLTRLNSPDRA